MTLYALLTELLATAQAHSDAGNVEDLRATLTQIGEVKTKIAELEVVQAELAAQLADVPTAPVPVAETPEPPAAPEPPVQPEPPVVGDPAPVPPVPVEPPGRDEVPAPANVTPAPVVVAETAPVLELVAAAPAPAAPTRRSATVTPATIPTVARTSIVAAMDVPAVAAGTEFSSIRDLANAFVARRETFGASPVQENLKIASVRASRQLHEMVDDMARDEETLVTVIKEAQTKVKALTASGGACAPATPVYDIFGVGTSDRPILDSLPSVSAPRYKIRYTPGLSLSDFTGALTKWTATLDETSPQTNSKDCYHIECGTEAVAEMYAQVQCLSFGNIMGRAFPERIAKAIELTAAAHARKAERDLLATIDANSTANTTTAYLGAARDIPNTIARAAAGIRNRLRAEDSPLTLLLPEWAESLIGEDLRNQLPGDNTWDITDQQIADWFGRRNINVVYIFEGGSGEDFTSPDTGDLDDYPTTLKARLFPVGAHVVMDGGSLDLGLVRDSTLNSTNDYQFFAETFEGLYTPGYESHLITLPNCHSGASAGTITPVC